MKWVTLIVRVLVALPFVVLAPDHFLHYLNMPPPDNLSENAKSFAGLLMQTGYMDVVKALEIVGNWTNRYSTFSDQFGNGMNSTPPPAVHPVTVEFADAPIPFGLATLSSMPANAAPPVA